MRKILLSVALVLAVLALWLVISPPRFWLNLTKSVEPTVMVGAQLVEQNNCRGCHRIGGEGALKGPTLDEVMRRQAEADPAQVTLRLWLRDPKAIKSNTAMPNFHLSDSQIEAILLYLQEEAATAAK
ncbi:MAG: cytochrome c [Chloroflexi bacterium]|nr:MAG: cytochrome c [Chloroflexota bacterium]